MKKKVINEKNGTWWKVLIVLTFLISLVCLMVLISNKIPQYEYYTKLITLDNTNDFSYVDGRIVNYLCDEGMVFRNHRDSYYASTSEWVGDVDKGFKGTCLIKIKRRIIQ